jgi:cytochrome c1
MIMKKPTITSIILAAGIGAAIIINGCAATQIVKAKTGMQLWGENCIRCHNAPSSADYSNAQWETIGMHMKLRADLTDDEITKVVEFLKSSN